MKKKYKSFKSFYPFYLSQHKDKTCRLFHFIGTGAVIAFFTSFIILGNWKLFWVLPVLGYTFAWIGHFVFEKNKPATFQYPLFSLFSDFLMFWHIISGQIEEKMKNLY